MKRTIKIALTLLIILQVVLWSYTSKETQQDDLLPRLLPLLIFISFILWSQVVALIRYPNEMDRMDKFLIKYRPNLIKDPKKRRKAGVIFGLVVIAILFIEYTVFIVSYICAHFLWIMHHFAKVTRILGLITLLGCIIIIILGVYDGKKKREKIISKNNIIVIGLLAENIVISMLLIIS